MTFPLVLAIIVNICSIVVFYSVAISAQGKTLKTVDVEYQNAIDEVRQDLADSNFLKASKVLSRLDTTFQMPQTDLDLFISTWVGMMIKSEQYEIDADSLLTQLMIYYNRCGESVGLCDDAMRSGMLGLVDGRKYEVAKEVCDSLITGNPSNLDAYSILLMIYKCRLGEYKGTAEGIGKAPFSDVAFDSIICLHELLLLKCDLTLAPAAVFQIIEDCFAKIGDDIARHKLEDAIRMYESGNTSAAIDSLKCAVKYAKTLEEPAYNLGVIYLQRNDAKSAEVCFKELVDNNCKMLEPYVRLGEIYLGQGHPKEAAATFALAEARVTSDTSQHAEPSFYYNYGLALLKSERYPEARAKFTQAIAGDKEFCDALYNLAGVCLRLGEYKCAQENLRKACDCWGINCRAMINSMIGETAEQKQQAADSSR